MRNRIISYTFVAFLLFPFFLVPKGVVASSVIGTTTVTLYPIADTYVNSSSPDTNYGNANRLYLRKETAYAYIMFNLSSIPLDANIISVELKVYLSNIGGYTGSIGAHYCSNDSWTELDTNWNNRPIFAEVATGTVYYGMWVTYGYDSWNVTTDVINALSKGKLSEVLVDHRSSSYAYFNSREGSSSPKLEIEYTTLPIFAVHLESIQDTGGTNNLGITTFADNTFSLPTDIDIVAGSYQISYIGGYNFVRWETSGGVNVSDSISQNTTVTVSGSGTLMAVGNAKRIEYSYDSGNLLWESEKSGCIDAVRFTPLCPSQLMTARFYITGLSWNQSQNTFKVHVMDADRNDIIPPFTQTPTSADNWFDVDLSNYGLNVTADVDFYIGIEWMFDDWPAIDKTYGHPQSRSWYWNGTTWTIEDNYDFMIRAVVGTLIDHRVTDGFDFQVSTESNSTISNFEFIQAEKKMLFNITGPSGTVGFCNVTIPKQLLGGHFDVLVDGENVTDFILSANATHNSLYFTYEHSWHWVEIIGTTVIPEFTGFLLSLMLMATTLIALIFRKKIKRCLQFSL